jgi:tetraacyldisaccharide 4'-kinase
MFRNIRKKPERSRVLKKIKTLMTGCEKTGMFSPGSILSMFAVAYGAGVKLRATLYKKGILASKRLPCIVISIGNLTVGGTGKTPMTIYLAELLKQFGYQVAVISRGYKGEAERSGGIVSDGRQIFLGADQAGDEPFLVATRLKNVPVVVGQNRYMAGLLALEKFHPDVLLLDDAFQHLQLERDMDLVLLDGSHPFGNSHLLPRGTLREPVSSLSRGDAFVLTRSDFSSDVDRTVFEKKCGERIQNLPVFKSAHTPYVFKTIICNQSARPLRRSFSCERDGLKGHRVFAFSGIARNDDFKKTVERLKCDLAGFLGFPDHHPYSDEDFNTIVKASNDAEVDLIMTTEKDYVRIAGKMSFPIDMVVMGIKISFEDKNGFDAFIKKRLSGLKNQIPI